MLLAEFLDNGCLQVIEVVHSWTDTKRSYTYYDLERGLKSYIGREGETPSVAMTADDISWVQKHYVPLAEKQKAVRDAEAKLDPDRFEKARRWTTLVTASLVSDGSYDTLSREQIRDERRVRYNALEATSRMPSDGEMAVAKQTISERDATSAPILHAIRERG